MSPGYTFLSCNKLFSHLPQNKFDEPSTSKSTVESFTFVDTHCKTLNFKTASVISSDTSTPLYPKLSSSSLSISSVDDSLVCEPPFSQTNKAPTASPQKVTDSYNLKPRPYQSSSSSGK